MFQADLFTGSARITADTEGGPRLLVIITSYFCPITGDWCWLVTAEEKLCSPPPSPAAATTQVAGHEME